MNKTANKLGLAAGLTVAFVGVSANAASATSSKNSDDSKSSEHTASTTAPKDESRCDVESHQNGDQVSVHRATSPALASTSSFKRLVPQFEIVIHREGNRETCVVKCATDGASDDSSESHSSLKASTKSMPKRLEFDDDVAPVAGATGDDDTDHSHDDCVTPPPPVVPESPMTVLLPLVGVSSAALLMKSRKRASAATLA